MSSLLKLKLSLHIISCLTSSHIYSVLTWSNSSLFFKFKFFKDAVKLKYFRCQFCRIRVSINIWCLLNIFKYWTYKYFFGYIFIYLIMLWRVSMLPGLAGVLWAIPLSTVLWPPTSMAQLPARRQLLWRVSHPLSLPLYYSDFIHLSCFSL